MVRFLLIISFFTGFLQFIKPSEKECADTYLSPANVCVSEQKEIAFVSMSTSARIAVIDILNNKLKGHIDLPFNPGDLAISKDSKTLYVTDGRAEGKVHFISLKKRKIIASIEVGHTPVSCCLSHDGTRLFIANRFSNSISVIDVNRKKNIKNILVERDPVEICLSPDGKTIAVANLLPASAATDTIISSKISMIDRSTLEVTRNIALANGSQSVRGLTFSKDGKFLYAAHILSRNTFPTSQIEHGWINSNAISVIDVDRKAYVTSFLLDNYNKGAANPSEMIITDNGKKLIIALAGVHELCFIDLPALHAMLESADQNQIENLSNDLLALNKIKERKEVEGKSPRHLASFHDKIFVSSYFSTALEIFDIEDLENAGKIVSLGNESPWTSVRYGELYFADADLCFQKWQSCVSCHPDARADGLNWDLLNDGAGNPKSGKSLLYSHFTPPVMVTGIRENAEIAVRSGIKYIQFTEPEESVAVDIDNYLKSLKPVPSPYLINGVLTENALKGKEIFSKAGCLKCHSGKYFTDKSKYDVGTGKGVHEGELFDVPGLNEIWRTAPYLYDGRAKTIKDVLTVHNESDQHGTTNTLSDQEIDYLTEYVLSL